ncbi:hypothetical protein ACWCOW_42690 [Streptomyces sp. NPDC001939]
MATHEAEALRELYVTCQDQQHEYESALAVTGRAIRLQDAAEVYHQGSTLSVHHDALAEGQQLASAYERARGQLAWRYASASMVLEVRVLERLVQGRDPLTDAEVAALCKEPTLDQLRQALSIPSSVLLTARDEERQEQHDTVRRAMLTAVNTTIEYAAEIDDSLPAAPDTVAAGRLTDYDRPGHQPLYEGLLEQLLARTGLYAAEIDWYLKTPAAVSR